MARLPGGSRYVKRLTAPAAVCHVSGRRMKSSDAGYRGWPQWQSESFHAARGSGRRRSSSPHHRANLVPLKAGEAFEYAFGGGGGWGDPLERDPQRVCEDVLDEYVTPEGARRDYGVVLRGSLEALDLTVDFAATQRLRETQRASSVPARPRSGRAASRGRAEP